MSHIHNPEIQVATNRSLMERVESCLQNHADILRDAGIVKPEKNKWRDEYIVSHGKPLTLSDAPSIGRFGLRVGTENLQVTSASLLMVVRPTILLGNEVPDLQYMKVGIARKDHSLNKITFFRWRLPTHALEYERRKADRGKKLAEEHFRAYEEAFFDPQDQGIHQGATDKKIEIIGHKGLVDNNLRNDLVYFLTCFEGAMSSLGIAGSHDQRKTSDKIDLHATKS